MKDLILREGDLRIAFHVREDDTAELVDFSAAEGAQSLNSLPLEGGNADGYKACQLIALQITGRSSLDETHGGKHIGGSESPYLKYRRHELVWEDETGRILQNARLRALDPAGSTLLSDGSDAPSEKGAKVRTQGAEGEALLSDGQDQPYVPGVRRHLTIHLRSSGAPIEAEYHMLLFPGIQMVRVWTLLRNAGTEPLGIEYVSSFIYTGLGHGGSGAPYRKLRIATPYNSWDSEAQWKIEDIDRVGISCMPMDGYNLSDVCTNRYTYGSIGSWSTGRHLPVALAEDPETGELWYGQIEHSGSWQIEYGIHWGRRVYVALMGPDNESEWWKELAPGETFTTVPAGFGACRKSAAAPAGTGFTSAFDELTKYRRAIREASADDGRRIVVFNDYMNCLFGDPTEARELPMIELAAGLGAECYCIDAGWYDDGPWWDSIGEWKEAPGRFPGGLKKVIDFIRSKGMRAGLWIEIEAMGTACALSGQLPDSWFICRHGRRRVDSMRYLLDFRNPKVRRYCTDVIDRLISDYGVSYFKIDYNVTTGAGSDVGADSPGDALIEHVRCLYNWIREQYERHPGLIIENCGSGAQRMDYGILSLHSLQSTTDNTDYLMNNLVAANIATAVTPEQCGQWVYPYRDEREHVIYCMVGGLLLRPYLSGNIWAMSQENLDLMREGTTLYKERLRRELGSMLPFWPLGLHDVHSRVMAFGMKKAQQPAGDGNGCGCDFSSLGSAVDDEGAGGNSGYSADRAAVGAGTLAYLAVFLVKETEAAIPLTDLLPAGNDIAAQQEAIPDGARKSASDGLSANVIDPASEDLVRHVLQPDKLRAKVIYPASEDCAYRVENGVLYVSAPAPATARLFEITAG